MLPVLRLLCLPPAGASASMYLRWRRGLPAWVEIVPVELPGRGARFGEPFAHDFDGLVRQLCREQAARLSDPCVLFGHSMGALLAHGMAQHLRVSGARLPLALLASACPAPSRRDVNRFAGKDGDAALIEDLRRQGGVPPEVFASEEMLRLTLEVLRADYRVCRSFEHRQAPPLPLPLQVLAGCADDIEQEQMEAWRLETDRWFSIQWFDGGHFFIRPREADVLKVIGEYLVRVWQGGVHAADSLA